MTRIAFNIHHPADRERLQQLAFVIADGARVEIKPPKRSDEQNARLWWMLGQIAKQVDWYGQKLGAEDWKVVFTASLRQSRVVPGIDPSTFVVLGLQTSDMGVTEFANLIELATAFAAERGVVFPERRAA